jgi:hypothetical protein
MAITDQRIVDRLDALEERIKRLEDIIKKESNDGRVQHATPEATSEETEGG